MPLDADRPRQRWTRAATHVSTVVALALTLILAASACSGSDDATSPTTPQADARTDSSQQSTDRNPTGKLEWRKCDLTAAAECATLAVPLDWADVDGAKIELALGRIVAGGQGRNNLVINPGGPGGSGLRLLAANPVGFSVTMAYDIVSWDPRGVGQSTALRCGDAVGDFVALDPEPDNAKEVEALEDSAEAVSDECADSDLDLLKHMRTEDTARDLEAIRAALGDEQLNYLGYSYGTHIGQVYASLFPDQVGKMVLDGVVDPDESFSGFLLSQTAAFDAAFERQDRKCGDAGKVSCGVESLGDAYDTVLKTAEKKPIPAKNGPAGPAEVTMAAITSAYQPRGWHTLGPALRQALAGDGNALRNLADSYQDMASFTPYAAVICTDGPTPRGVEKYRDFAEQATKVSRRFGAAIANELLPCATWPVKTEKAEPLSIADIPPILLIGNTGDPATPLENAKRVNKRIPDSVLITVDSEGHTAYGSNACVDGIVEAYLSDGSLPDVNKRSC